LCWLHQLHCTRRALLLQLKVGGRLIAPVQPEPAQGQALHQVDRTRSDHWALTVLDAIFAVRVPDGVVLGRHILAVCVILNALLCLTVTVLHAAKIEWFYNASFLALFALFVSF
jgi:hypothetical protein